MLLVSFNVIFPIQYFPSATKQARMFSILKPGKDPALPSSYRPQSLLETTGKSFEKIILTRIIHEVSGYGLLLNVQYGFIRKHSTALHLTQLLERVSWKFDEERPIGAVFFDVANASDNVRVDGLLYKLTP